METFFERYSRGSCDELMGALACDPSDDTAYVMVMYEMLNDTRKMCKICPEAVELYNTLKGAWSNMDSVQVDVNYYHQRIKAVCDQYAEKRLSAIERILDDPEGPLKKVRVDE